MFERLRSLIKARRNQPISRSQLEDALWSQIPEEIRGDRGPIRIVTATEDIDQRSSDELVFCWKEFFGGEGRSFPMPDAWARMRSELLATRDWLVGAERPRRILLSGSRRLSTSLCIGSVFSAVSGFTIEVEYRGDTWRSDDFEGAEYGWEVEKIGTGKSEGIAVGIGVLKDLREDVLRYLGSHGRGPELRLLLHAHEPMAGAAVVNAAVAAAKNAIRTAASAASAKVLHLFVAAPGPFALFLGHRLNALGQVQCYEWTGEGRYVETCQFAT